MLGGSVRTESGLQTSSPKHSPFLSVDTRDGKLTTMGLTQRLSLFRSCWSWPAPLFDVPVRVIGDTREWQCLKLGQVDRPVSTGSKGEKSSVRGYFVLTKFQLKYALNVFYEVLINSEV